MSESPQSPTLSALSDGLAAAVERAGAGTVTVDARRRLPASGIVWDDQGLIVTASHVVEREEAIQVGLANGAAVPATLLGRDLSRDLVLLRVETGGDALTPAPRRTAPVRVGNIVLAVGRPRVGGGPTATFGTVVAIGQGRRTTSAASLISAEVTMLPGFSGGPLVDVTGEIAGLNTSGPARSGGVTIPVAQIERVATEVQAHGRVRHGWLGVTLQSVTLPEGTRDDAGEQTTGLLVVNIASGSPAATAGLIVGDILIALDDQDLVDVADLQQNLTGDRIGTALPARVLRGGERREIAVTPAERPEPTRE
ncbi:MAG: trypsin-like peptidase domain-containing protein [Chloroflexia bacterium]|nr:trypsin-like peptidase domain-containing protein [Chloroflexia bacterium]